MGVEDIARRRLPLFSAYYHGDPLRIYVYHESPKPLYLGFHGKMSWTKGETFPYRCDQDEDAQAFLDPQGLFRFEYHKGAEEEVKRWLAAIRGDDLLLTTTMQACIRKSEELIAQANRALEFPMKEARALKDPTLTKNLSDAILKVNSAAKNVIQRLN